MAEPAASPSDAPAAPDRRFWRADALLLALGAALLRLPALLASAHLDFDDAVYGASAMAMRHGALPFREVFSSQGPLHLPLVWAGDLLGARTSWSPRLTSVAAGVVAAVATYAAGRRLGTRAGALLAGALVASSGSVLWTTGPITADGPALALTAAAVALALRYRAEPSTARAVATGAVLGAALSVKAPLVLLATIPVAGLLLASRRLRDTVGAAAAAVAVALAATLPWGFGRVWDQSVAYQLDSDRNASMAGNARKILSTLWDRDTLLVATGTLALLAVLIAARRGRRAPASSGSRRLETRLVGAWFVSLVLFLVVEPAMWRNHIAHVIVPAALLVACRPPPLRLLAATVLFAVPFQAAHLGDVLHPPPYRGGAAEVVAALRALPAGAWAISDDPGFVWRAGRATPPDLVDTSIKRIEQRRVTARTVADAAADPRVCAVVVWSARHFGTFVDLPSLLATNGYREVARFGGPRVLYRRDDCAGSE